jgi:N6-adenosine-specific RNA methylase IME4
MSWPFDPLQMFGYNIILADFPTAFNNWSEAGEDRNPNRHYDTMQPEEVMKWPVGQLASNNCALFLWIADPIYPWAFKWAEHWGFRYVTRGFEWAKLNPSGEGYFMSTGYYTRGNPESCLLFMTGKLSRVDAGVRQLIVEPVREHSRKPDRIHTDIERLFGGPDNGVFRRCELFGRQSRPGWEVWGNEPTKFDDQDETTPRRRERRPRNEKKAPEAPPQPLFDRDA